MYGHSGKFLKVNLSTGKAIIEEYDESFARKYLGGNGFAAKMIYDNVPATADPLGPENGICFAVGPLTDTPVWGTSRGHMASISPQTGYFADSNYGGDFGMAQKRTGFDAIFINGSSGKPVYILVTENGAQIKDASHVWGKTTEETNEILEAEAGKGAISTCIGPGGENLVIFANVCCGGKRPGSAGRAGLGAVMGAKKLKAVVCMGDKKTAVAHPEELKAYLKEKLPELRQNRGGMTKVGTSALPNMINSKGMLGTRNNQRETFDQWQEISGDFFLEKYKNKDTACHGCVLACGKEVNVTTGEYKGKSVKMPEYETLYAMGSMLDNANIVSIFNGNHMCDLMGMDTISMGVTLSFVAECMERGLITEQQLGGVVKFQDGDGMVDLIKQTAFRKGAGNLLALGSQQLAKKFGGDTYKYLYTVQGLECAGHSARGLRGMGLSYAVSTRGGSHHDGRPNYVGHAHPDPGFDPIPDYIVKSNYFTCLGDSLVVCRFIEEGMMKAPAVHEDMAKFVNLVTDWNIDVAGLEKIGERIYNLERLISVSRGASRKDDVLPYRVMNEPIPDGPAQGRYVSQEDLNAMIEKYYAIRGWDHNGIPAKEKLAELGLQ
ncbi:MAG: aldehyde ferredoxin oxidoreductase family protein [Deltaproteobacteria bacterium]|nr:aldehyde ferredoxin oxidoreductase family protein [Deltaproteobacteria bacterium]